MVGADVKNLVSTGQISHGHQRDNKKSR